MSVEDELKVEHFKHLCEQTRHFNDKLTEAFTFFVQTFSVVVGGCVWLCFEKSADVKIHAHILTKLSDTVIILLTVVSVARVVGNLDAWYGYREKQHNVYAKAVGPDPLSSIWLEIVMTFSIIAAAVVFWRYNPFAVIFSN